MPNTITKIGDCAFRNCSKLTSVTIPDNVTSIGTRAFMGCTKLTTLFIPESVTKISGSSYAYGPFYLCSKTLKLYCETTSKLSGWSSYWNSYENLSGKVLSVTWGITREEYESTYKQ